MAATGVMHELDQNGDTRMEWDRDDQEQVARACARFNELRKRGFLAYRTLGKSDIKGEVIDSFDPNAEKIILLPQMVGG